MKQGKVIEADEELMEPNIEEILEEEDETEERNPKKLYGELIF